MNSNDNENYSPNESYKFFIFIFLGLLICWILLLISTWIDLLSIGYSSERGSLMLYLGLYTIIPMGVLAVYTKIGRHVSISERGFSKPSLLKKLKPIYLPVNDIKTYDKIFNIHEKDEIIGVCVTTNRGKRIKYLDSKTPGISVKIFEILEKHNINEVKSEKPLYAQPPRKIPEKAIWDWNKIDREQNKEMDNN